MFSAKNGSVELPSGVQDYVRFGRGSETLVMIPGVGDGLKTVRGMALPFALLYRSLAREFTVYAFSRRRDLPAGVTTRDMAEDLDGAMGALGIRRAAVVGVSQGGMIAQWLAADHPDRGGRLVLAVTAARANDTVRDVVSRWLGMADRGDLRGILLDTAERSYSPKRLRTARLENAVAGAFARQKDFGRFRAQAESCLTHDAYGELARIACPTLVIGGREDRIVTGEASEELAAAIPGAELYMYDGLGHGLYEEAPDFFARAAGFCRRA